MRYGLIFGLLMAGPAALIAADQSDFVYEEQWKYSKTFESGDAVKEAFELEQAGKHKQAAKLFESVFYASQLPGNRSLSLLKTAENHEKNGKWTDAQKAYTRLVQKYGASPWFGDAADGLLRCAKYFQANRGQWFTNNLSRAIECYETLLNASPFSEKAPQALVLLAALQEDSIDSDKAIATYGKVLKNFRQAKPELETAYFSLIRIYHDKSASSDNDASFSTTGLKYCAEFIANFPESENLDAVKDYQKKFRETKAMHFYNIGDFYTWEYHENLSSARYYFYYVIKNYPETYPAHLAEQKLLAIDPEFDASDSVAATSPYALDAQTEAAAVGAIVEGPQQNPLRTAKDPASWEKFKPLPVAEQDRDKWLLPLEEVKGE